MKLKFIIASLLIGAGTLTTQAQGIEFMPDGSLFREAVAKAKAGQMRLSRPVTDILDMLIKTLNGENVLPS